MQTRIKFDGMDVSEPMRDHAADQLKKIEKFLERERTPITITLVLKPSKIHAHNRAELFVLSPNFDLASTYEGADFYLVLRRVIDTMYRELLEAKRKLVDDRKGTDPAEDFIDNQ